MTRRGRAPQRIPAGSVPDRDWQWNRRGGAYDGVHTREGCLTWYTEAGQGGGATDQSFEDFLRKGAPVEAPPAVLAELHALLLPLVPDALPAERLAWAAEAGDRAQIEAALASGAEIDAREGKRGTALDRAARNAHTAAIDLLVNRGAHVTAETWTAAKDPAAIEALARAGTGGDDLAAHVRVLGSAAAYNPAAHERMQAALDALRDAAVAGRDLSRYERALVAATHVISQTQDIQRLMQALCWDCVRARDGHRLARLVYEARFAHHLMEELELAAREGRDVGPVLPGLIEGLNGDREEPLVRDRLARAIVAYLLKQAPDELGPMAGRLAGAPEVLAEVVKELDGAGRDVAPALGVTARGLARGGDAARYAASTLARVSGRADLSAYVPALRARLRARKPMDRVEAALTLGHEFLRREPPDWTAFDELHRSSSVPVRDGALITLSWALGTGRDVTAASSRIAQALLDREEKTRQYAARILKEAQRDGLALAPDAAALGAILQKLEDAQMGPGIEGFVHDLAGRGDVESRLVAAAVGVLSGERARELRRACDGYLSGSLRRPCSICAYLPADGIWSNEGSLPRQVLRLQPGGDYTKEGKRERRCPECGNAYETTYEAEYDVTSLDETFTLKRIAMPELHARLTEDLQHPHPAIRSEAKRLLGRG